MVKCCPLCIVKARSVAQMCLFVRKKRLICSNPALQASGKKKLALFGEWVNTMLTEIAGGLRDLSSPYG